MTSQDRNRLPTRAVRKIKGNAISMTGRVSGQQLESSLERDFLTLIRFDFTVERFLTQSVQVNYQDAAGRIWPYTPDCLVIYRQTHSPSLDQSPMLCEVKYEKELREDQAKLEPKFSAARSYCGERGWRFGVFSETDIRTPLLENARFLLPYRKRKFPTSLTEMITQWFCNEGPTTPRAFLASIGDDDRLNALAALWHLVATHSLGCDLNQAKISARTLLWHVQPEAQ